MSSSVLLCESAFTNGLKRQREGERGEDFGVRESEERMVFHSTGLGQRGGLETTRLRILPDETRCICTCMCVSVCAFRPVLTLLWSSSHTFLFVSDADSVVCATVFFSSSCSRCLSPSTSVFSTLTCLLVLLFSPPPRLALPFSMATYRCTDLLLTTLPL